MRVLVFGASITQGFWDTEGGWVARLRKYYDEQSVKDLHLEDNYPDIFNLGISGDTSRGLLNRFENEASARIKRGGSAAILFSVGTNNAIAGEGRPPFSPEEYKKDLESLIEKARKFTDKIMFVGLPPCEEEKTTPVFWDNISYTNERISTIDEVMKETAANFGLPHVQVFNVMKGEMAKGRQLFADGLHPNNEGHQLIADLVKPELEKLVK